MTNVAMILTVKRKPIGKGESRKNGRNDWKKAFNPEIPDLVRLEKYFYRTGDFSVSIPFWGYVHGPIVASLKAVHFFFRKDFFRNRSAVLEE